MCPSLQPRALIRFGEFLQPFLIEFPRYLCLQPGFFFSFTIGIFPFFIFRHSQSSLKRRHSPWTSLLTAKMTLIKRKGLEYSPALKYMKTWGKTLTNWTGLAKNGKFLVIFPCCYSSANTRSLIGLPPLQKKKQTFSFETIERC